MNNKSSDLGSAEQRDHQIEAEKHLVESGFATTHYAAVCPNNKLFVDIDVPYCEWSPSEKFVRSLEILQQVCGMEQPPTYVVEMSKGGNTHVIVEIPSSYISIGRRIAWQAILGGDPVREACHLLSCERGELNPIILFRRKEERLLTDGR